MRRGFLLHMWTGAIENPRTGKPFVFRSEETAKKYLARMPSWGHAAVTIYRVKTNGIDYIVSPAGSG